MEGGIHNPPTYETVYITPWTFQNRSNYPLNQFWKIIVNHKKNHKIENPIVLDSKWVELYIEHIIWYALVFFCCSFRSMLFFITVKKCTEVYHIICSLCGSTHLESNTIGFLILWFFCDLLWFFKTALGDNLTSFGKFRGWYRPFHRLGGYVVHPQKLRGWYRLFLFFCNDVQVFLVFVGVYWAHV